METVHGLCGMLLHPVESRKMVLIDEQMLSMSLGSISFGYASAVIGLTIGKR